MDAQKVDAFIMANGKFFPDYQVAANQRHVACC